MKQGIAFKHKFVESLPDALEEKTLYVCMEFATAAHKCSCGCGREVITPLSPTDWKLIYDGRTVTLHPSIGNWSFPCRSHYWVRRNRVEWAPAWSDEENRMGRMHDRHAKEIYFDSVNEPLDTKPSKEPQPVAERPMEIEAGALQKFIRWLKGR